MIYEKRRIRKMNLVLRVLDNILMPDGTKREVERRIIERNYQDPEAELLRYIGKVVTIQKRFGFL